MHSLVCINTTAFSSWGELNLKPKQFILITGNLFSFLQVKKNMCMGLYFDLGIFWASSQLLPDNDKS